MDGQLSFWTHRDDRAGEVRVVRSTRIPKRRRDMDAPRYVANLMHDSRGFPASQDRATTAFVRTDVQWLGSASAQQPEATGAANGARPCNATVVPPASVRLGRHRLRIWLPARPTYATYVTRDATRCSEGRQEIAIRVVRFQVHQEALSQPVDPRTRWPTIWA